MTTWLRAVIVSGLSLVLCGAALPAATQADGLERDVQAAGEKGVAFLSKLRTVDNPFYRGHPLYELQALTLLVWDQSLDQTRVSQCLARMNELPWDHTYNAALRACVYAIQMEKDPDDIETFARLAMAAKFLVETQLPSGLWSYGLAYLPGGKGYLKGEASARVVDEQVSAATAKVVEYGRQIGAALKKAKGSSARYKKGSNPFASITVDGTIRGRLQDGDFSNSQLAVLGLAAASKARLRVAPDVYLVMSVPAPIVEKAMRGWLEAQTPDGGWGYDGSRMPSYFSMTAGGLFSLTALQEIGKQLSSGNPQAAPVKKLAEVLGRIQPGVEKATAWLQNNYSVESNARAKDAWPDDSPSLFHFYALFSIERAATVAGLNKLGDHDWYADGARWLIKAQSDDGGWPEETVTKSEGQESPEAKRSRRDIATCFALLFLKRATSRIVPKDVATPGRERKP